MNMPKVVIGISRASTRPPELELPQAAFVPFSPPRPVTPINTSFFAIIRLKKQQRPARANKETIERASKRVCVCVSVCVRERESEREAHSCGQGPCARWNLQEEKPCAAQTIGRPLQTSVPIGVARTVLASQGRSRRRRAGRRRQGGHSGCAPIHPHSGRPPPRRIPVRRLCCLAASVNEAPRQPRERRAPANERARVAREGYTQGTVRNFEYVVNIG